MQSTNRFTKKQKILLVVFIFFVIFLLMYLVLNRKEEDTSTPNEYYDPGSGETVSNPENREPEQYEVPDTPSAQITFLGLKDLLDSGVSKYQLESYKGAIGEFSEINDSFIKEASINISTINSEMIPEDEKVYNKTSFELTINRNIKYSAELYMVDLRKAYLILKRGDEQIFKSSILDGYEEIYIDEDDSTLVE